MKKTTCRNTFEAKGNPNTVNNLAISKQYPVQDLQYEVACGDTRLGYLDWVEHKKESDGN